ncbi:MAG: amidohydrolase [Chloroflexi bacterium]|nr:amidohydrolase [Chloroflexota bacterium]
MTAGRIVDADSHILEPAEMWVEYMEPEFRDRALRINRDEKGLEYLDIDGLVSAGYSGGLGSMAGVGKSLEWKAENATKPYSEQARLTPAAIDPHERIRFMDQEGVDFTFLYPTLGLGWEGECEDAALSAAYCRAYNNWMVDFCRPQRERIIPIAHVSVRDVNEGVKELERVAKLGMKGVFISPHALNGIRYGHEYYDPFWNAAQELQMPVTLHVVFNPSYVGRHLYPEDEGLGPSFFVETMLIGDFLLSFTSMMCDGVFEKFPGLRLVMVEVGCGWISHWLDEMDANYEKFGRGMPLTMKPSDYFKRQCWISAEPTENSIAAMAQHVGADRFLWGSDWPHTEGHIDPVRKVKERIASLSEDDQRKILGENALTLYRMEKPAQTVG